MNKYFDQVNRFVEEHKDEIIDKWAQFVNLEGRFDEKENVEKAQAWLRREMEEIDFRCWTVPSREDRCSVLMGVLGEDRPGKPIIFAGHVDTVHPKGSFGKENPFYIEDGKAYGPGVLDMKGGIVLALYVVKALKLLGFEECPIKCIFDCEEEGDHVGTDVDVLITEESRGARLAMNMETGHISNSLCVGRKTQYTFYAKIYGKGGHAGNEFTKGHNATSIPDYCEFAVDVRIMNRQEGERIQEAFDKIMKTTYVEGTTTEYELVKAKLHEFEPNEKIMALYNFLNKAAVDNGFEPFGTITLGGATDTGALAMADIPALCSCGVIGEFNHNRKEYAVVQSMFDRIKIYACALMSLDQFPVK